MCRTLDDLNEQLKKEGFELSRSALYLRYDSSFLFHFISFIFLFLLGYCRVDHYRMKGDAMCIRCQSNSNEQQNTARRQHPDQFFAAATINYLKELAVTMGERCVFFLSQDDKARVPLGLPAAHKQAPILMHLEYEIRLPDHDWVIAESHKLIPSVYAACEIKDSVTYSGPTFIAIRYV